MDTVGIRSQCGYKTTTCQSESLFGNRRWIRGVIGILLPMGGLYLSSLYHYLLFHSLAEMCIVLGFWAVFIVVWNCRGFMANNYLLFLGIAYLFLGGLELLHALAYKGMGIFHGYDSNLATQLWIAARYMESLSLLAAPLFLHRRLKTELALTAYSIITLLALSAVFYWHVFPACFKEGVGLTPFKMISEYVISVILIAAVSALFRQRKGFDEKVFHLIVASIAFAIVSELAFTFYISAYGFSNLLGHCLKLISVYLMYRAVVETGLTKPYSLLFRDLNLSREAMRREKDFSERLIDTAPVMIVALNPDGRITRFNRYMEDLCGYRLDEVKGRDWFSTFLPGENQSAIKEGVMAVLRGVSRSHIHLIATKEGRKILTEWVACKLKDAGGEVIGILAVGQDVTARRQAEEEIQKSLKEKEVLLQEVHHRVKNNMQVIISLLNLQSDKIRDKVYADMFRESQERIKSMALIHEALYKTKDFSNIGFGEYIKNLSSHLFNSYTVQEGKIRLEIDAQDVSLGLDKAIPVALILNELLTNSLKYAFPEEGEGRIGICLRSTNVNQVELTVTDNGIGMPEGIDMGKTETLGLNLVHLLAEGQLDGEVELDRVGGTSFRIRFDV